MMECFEPNASAEQLLARMEIIGHHATSALYNAVEHRRIPFRFIWMPLAKVQEGLGGKTKAIVAGIGAGLVALIFALIFVPYPLKMEAKGHDRPEDCRLCLRAGRGHRYEIPGIAQIGRAMSPRIRCWCSMWDLKLQQQLKTLLHDFDEAQAEFDAFNALGAMPTFRMPHFGGTRQPSPAMPRTRTRPVYQANQCRAGNPGEFSLKAPISGIILTPDFRETLKGRTVKPNEQLIRIGKVAADPKNARPKNGWSS